MSVVVRQWVTPLHRRQHETSRQEVVIKGVLQANPDKLRILSTAVTTRSLNNKLQNVYPHVLTSRKTSNAVVEKKGCRRLIPTFGKRLLKLDLGLRREFNWPFIIATASQPIIIADFLLHFGLLVDIKNGIFIDPLTQLQRKGTLYAGNSSSVKAIIENSKFHQLLSEFPTLIGENTTPNKIVHGVEHWIQTNGPLFSPNFGCYQQIN
ncbi:retrovirus-related Pol polyprotein from transposon 297 [Caerostris extrusa]|uniref:Retrovirus-related Pol polyprotein from transposon 297 n=1 Tax=Caerostris extrusa TaxID=172846 RepID=A0AAV4WY49_CAEEX|nr:retrovirus-related Pol polyprotein from transposon 297 [Caerostris extrusa]